jgi:hypothetical protein
MTFLSANNPVAGFKDAFGGGFAGIGGLFLLLGVLMVIFGRRRRHRGVQSTGTIVGYGFHTWRGLTLNGSGGMPSGVLGTAGFGMTNNGPVECPIVEFQTLAGEPVHAMARNGSSPRPGRVGDPITVYYKANKPESFFAETGTSRRAAGCVEIAFIVLGAVFLVVGLEVLGS